MDLAKEIGNHLEWIDSIASLLAGGDLSEEELSRISRHDNCQLGQWLDSKGADRFRGYDEFQALLDSHAEFHQLAGNLVSALQQGEDDKALEAQELFIASSHNVITHLQTMEAMEEGKGSS